MKTREQTMPVYSTVETLHNGHNINNIFKAFDAPHTVYARTDVLALKTHIAEQDFMAF